MVFEYDITEIEIIDQCDILFPFNPKTLWPWFEVENEHPIIVLTPTCDIINEKFEHHRVSLLIPIEELVVKLARKKYHNTERIKEHCRKNGFKGDILNVLKNKVDRYHFLPSAANGLSSPKIIDFELIASIPRQQLLSRTFHCRLKSPFKENLIHRYSSHTMRIGVQNVDEDYLNTLISDQVEALHEHADEI